MTKTRNQYHYSVRRVKKMADQLRAEQLLEALETGDIDLNGKKADISLAECVEGADNPSDIVDKFRSVYSALYNSAPSAIQDLKDSLENDNFSKFEVFKVTGEKVKEAACRMKPNESDVSEG